LRLPRETRRSGRSAGGRITYEHVAGINGPAHNRPVLVGAQPEPGEMRGLSTSYASATSSGLKHSSTRNFTRARWYQENGYFVLRFLAEDVGKDLDAVLDSIQRTSFSRRKL
jgi:Protein of unknown function (DUF559)